MAVQVSYPGVYIEEFAPGAPIPGVSTSIVAFVGPAAEGDLDKPKKLTSWDQFKNDFGDNPISNSYFLWYAVRGFFENGGQTCYVVRASNGTYGRLTAPGGNSDSLLVNRAGLPMINVRARQPGNPTSPIQVEVIGINRLTGTTLYQPLGSYAGINERTITLSDADEAAQFRPGDRLNIEGQPARLVRVSGAELQIDTEVTAVPASGDVRLADASSDERTIRIAPPDTMPRDAIIPGTVLTIIQNTPGQNTTTVSGIVEVARREPSTRQGVPETIRVTFREKLAAPLSMNSDNPANIQSEEFDFIVSQNGAVTAHQNLSIDAAHERYFLDTINENDGLVTVELVEPPPSTSLPQSLPDDLPTTPLVGGSEENLDSMDQDDYIEALDTLREIDEVSIIVVPDVHTLDPMEAVTVQQAVIAHCELMADRFAILDARPGLVPFGSSGVEGQRQGLDSTRGYVALYYPWLRVFPASSGGPILVPPSGHIAGIYARTDNSRGVHKAPAGNESLVNGAFAVERTLSNIDQGQLNLKGINVIRVFREGGRPVVWGARTTATDTNWQYVNIRRLFLFLEESIQEGINWAVFEPNNLQLWQKLKRTINDFLTRAWRDGALFGETPDKAFYVRIDETLNPFSEQQLGRLHIEIGVRPSYPAEFIIVRIGIWDGGSQVDEG